jgi:hypothetical protein
VRFHVIPAFVLLAGAALFYTSYKSNKALLRTPNVRPEPAYAAAGEMAGTLRSGAERFHHDLGRWPDTLEDLNLDATSLRPRPSTESIRLGAAGEIQILLKQAGDAVPLAVTWTPRILGEKYVWDCATDSQEATRRLTACANVEPGARTIGSPPADRSESQIDVPDLDEKCQMLGRIAYAAARARRVGDSYDLFIHRPMVAFEDDADRRETMKTWARWTFDSPPRTPSASQREALRQARCLKP